MRTGRIVVMNGDAASQGALERTLQQAGYEVLTASHSSTALDAGTSARPEVVIAEAELLRELLERDSEIKVIVVSATPNVDTAVAALPSGPVPPSRPPRPRQLLGQSAPMQRLFRTVSQVSPSRVSVLITGERGTEKELFAESLHGQSPRAGGPFIRVSGAALASGDGESELFGHEKGATPGAGRAHAGRLERAHGGTLFLDEVADLSPAAQGRLLAFLQTRSFERVGGSDAVGVDVRVVAATERDLPSLVAAGSFREELFYRLNVVALHVPPLRDRPSDIPLLASALLQEYAEESGSPARGFSEVALTALTRYRWPGNVRELEHVVERAVVLADAELIGREHLPPELFEVARSTPAPPIPGSSLEELERHAILATLEANGGSTSQAARVLGISVRKIQYRLREYSQTRREELEELEERV